MRKYDEIKYVKFSPQELEEFDIKSGLFPKYKGDKMGRYITMVADDKTKIWSVDTQTLFTLTMALKKKELKLLEWSPDCGVAVLAIYVDVNDSFSLQLWDVTTRKCLHTFKIKLSVWDSIKFSPDGRFISCAAADGGVALCDTQTGEMVTTFKETIMARTTEWSPGGEELAVLAQDNRIVMLNMNQMLFTGTESCHD